MKMNSRDFSKKKVTGQFPEHGAIFMSNRSTLKECFERGLFGLPDAFSSFVKNVKAGMMLFLFQFEDRKLHGVYKAKSDGGMNIVPLAYASSGKQFPAQVKFTRILHYDPLSEDEFCDVIRDNYFTTKKFNFGLSKDQVQSLIWLFKSRKRQVPRSLHQKKSRKRKCNFRNIEDVLMKGRPTNTQKRKLNSHGTSVTAEQEVEKLILSPKSWGKCESIHFDGTSVTAEPEVEKLILSPKSWGKCESIHFDGDAYDPEHPGFSHHSVGSGTHSASSYESHELPTLQKEKANFHILEDDITEDFIPLCARENSDLEDGEIDNFSECSEEEQTELDMLVGNDISSILVPRFLLSNEVYNKTDDSSSPAVSDLPSNDENDHLNSLLSKGLYSNDVSSIPVPSFLLSNEEYNRTDDSSSPAVSDLQPKDENDHLNSLLSKGLYSDEPKNRTSVFSRLSFSSKAKASKNQNNAKGKGQYQYEKVEEMTQQSEDGTMYKRASVFLRLTGASDDVAPQIQFMAGLNEGTSGWMKA